LEPGETPEAGLRRELYEETGLERVKIGPCMWKRFHEFDWDGRRVRQNELYFLVRTRRFEPVMMDNPSAGEAAAFRGFRWWTADEIDAAAGTIFSPGALARLLRELLTDGPPSGPIDVGV